MSFREAEVCSSTFTVTVQLQAPLTNPGSVRQVPAQLCHHLLQASFPASTLFLTSGLVACSHSTPRGFLLSYQTSWQTRHSSWWTLSPTAFQVAWLPLFFFKLYFIDYAITIVLIFPPFPLHPAPPAPSGNRPTIVDVRGSCV